MLIFLIFLRREISVGDLFQWWIYVYEPLEDSLSWVWWPSSMYRVEAYFWRQLYRRGKLRTMDADQAEWYSGSMLLRLVSLGMRFTPGRRELSRCTRI